MADIILVTGGSRSGKSEYAQRLAERTPSPRLYLATCPVLDSETRERVERHRQARAGRGWTTIEETEDLARAIKQAPGGNVLLIDCLTLWVNNLMWQAEQAGHTLTEDAIREQCRELLAVCQEFAGPALLVTNEVGWGVVPDNPAGRRFRDLAGRCNQVAAEAASTVVLMVSGIATGLKGNSDGIV